jgi:hypothetical protein
MASRDRLRASKPVRFWIRALNEKNCQHCARFVDDPAVIEREFPGIKILGSMYASVRGSAGICREFDRFMDPIPAADCKAFVMREEFLPMP